jgi:hypothetical protein
MYMCIHTYTHTHTNTHTHIGACVCADRANERTQASLVNQDSRGAAGTQFTCFTGTKVRILTQKTLLTDTDNRQAEDTSLLVQKYEYNTDAKKKKRC